MLYAHSAAWIALLVLEARIGQIMRAKLEILTGRMLGKLGEKSTMVAGLVKRTRASGLGRVFALCVRRRRIQCRGNRSRKGEDRNEGLEIEQHDYGCCLGRFGGERVTESRIDNECEAFSKACIVKLYKLPEAFLCFSLLISWLHRGRLLIFLK